MRVRNIIIDQFVNPRIERWQLAYARHFVSGGFDEISHTPAQAFAMYALVAMYDQRIKMAKELCNELQDAGIIGCESHNLNRKKYD